MKQWAVQLAAATGIRRKGRALSFLMRFKQIYNHPSQWLGDGAWGEGDSGQRTRLHDIAEVVAARQEKMLVFTRLCEVTAPLAAFLGSVFERPGLVLHKETEVTKRKNLVRRCQQDEAVGFFVRSLKAGGLGLNLAAASHGAFSTISTDDGTRRWRARPRTAPSASATIRTCSCTSSSAAAR